MMDVPKCAVTCLAAILTAVFLTAAAPHTEPLLIWESPVFTGEGTEYYPDEVMIFEDQEYELVTFELVDVEQEGDSLFADASVTFLLEGKEEPPESAVITLMDDATGNEYEREVPLMRTTEKDVFWSDDFAFEITVTDYDADMYFLDGTSVMAGEDLKDYGKELIESLGLPEEFYCVKDVKWRGAPYEYEGIIMRDAVATGEKLVRSIEAVYGGYVETPAVKGKQYTAEYMPVIPDESKEETIRESETETEPETIAKAAETEEEEKAPEEVPGIIKRLFRWVKEHFSAVTLRAGFIIAAVLGMILLWRSGRPHGEARHKFKRLS